MEPRLRSKEASPVVSGCIEDDELAFLLLGLHKVDSVGPQQRGREHQVLVTDESWTGLMRKARSIR